jgi:RNA polymerase sigma-70 factor (ECF subfamily)
VGILDDRALVRRTVRDGDERSFRALYDRHTPRLLRFAYQITGGTGRGIAEDVVQETWLRAVEGLQRFQWRSQLATWLHGIALNVAREALRAESANADPVDVVDTSVPGDPERRIDLDRALGGLPEGRRTVLVLHDLQGYTHEEIASLLGITIGTSKSQLHDARIQLEVILTGGGKRDARR